MDITVKFENDPEFIAINNQIELARHFALTLRNELEEAEEKFRVLVEKMSDYQQRRSDAFEARDKADGGKE